MATTATPTTTEAAEIVKGRQRIRANCKIIWGSYTDYDLDFETDDGESWACYVKKDYGTHLGPPLVRTRLCSSAKRAWTELDRILGAWAAKVLGGHDMSRGQFLAIFGGSMKNKDILGLFIDEVEKGEEIKAGI